MRIIFQHSAYMPIYCLLIVKNAKAELEAEVDRLEFKNYNYNKIKIKGNLIWLPLAQKKRDFDLNNKPHGV